MLDFGMGHGTPAAPLSVHGLEAEEVQGHGAVPDPDSRSGALELVDRTPGDDSRLLVHVGRGQALAEQMHGILVRVDHEGLRFSVITLPADDDRFRFVSFPPHGSVRQNLRRITAEPSVQIEVDTFVDEAFVGHVASSVRHKQTTAKRQGNQSSWPALAGNNKNGSRKIRFYWSG